MASNVLFERDTNVKPSMEASNNVKPQSMEFHRQVLESKLKNGSQQTYISPSDTIMSPATEKLAAFKNKRLSKSMKPQSLFAKATANNSGLKPGGQTKQPMFADLPKETQSGPKEGL
ncbi:hypothetical protein EJ06DRAFT_526260 [Trichodelitschia bisporula]|uniref:Spo12-like protein n=1 Tax=Trichodelitschia bisporula TaxID=703511 RepID=A0A6G1I7K6_9PEZI|nr:hypothetical protein EJ06DRAFT_526260 [Trichodelitschia bisporula]